MGKCQDLTENRLERRTPPCGDGEPGHGSVGRARPGRKNQHLWVMENLKPAVGNRLGGGREDASLENPAHTALRLPTPGRRKEGRALNP